MWKERTISCFWRHFRTILRHLCTRLGSPQFLFLRKYELPVSCELYLKAIYHLKVFHNINEQILAIYHHFTVQFMCILVHFHTKILWFHKCLGWDLSKNSKLVFWAFFLHNISVHNFWRGKQSIPCLTGDPNDIVGFFTFTLWQKTIL